MLHNDRSIPTKVHWPEAKMKRVVLPREPQVSVVTQTIRASSTSTSTELPLAVKDQPLPFGAIVGGTVSGMLIVLLVVGGWWWWGSRMRASREKGAKARRSQLLAARVGITHEKTQSTESLKSADHSKSQSQFSHNSEKPENQTIIPVLQEPVKKPSAILAQQKNSRPPFVHPASSTTSLGSTKYAPARPSPLARNVVTNAPSTMSENAPTVDITAPANSSVAASRNLAPPPSVKVVPPSPPRPARMLDAPVTASSQRQSVQSVQSAQTVYSIDSPVGVAYGGDETEHEAYTNPRDEWRASNADMSARTRAPGAFVKGGEDMIKREHGHQSLLEWKTEEQRHSRRAEQAIVATWKNGRCPIIKRVVFITMCKAKTEDDEECHVNGRVIDEPSAIKLRVRRGTPPAASYILGCRVCAAHSQPTCMAYDPYNAHAPYTGHLPDSYAHASSSAAPPDYPHDYVDRYSYQHYVQDPAPHYTPDPYQHMMQRPYIHYTEEPRDPHYIGMGYPQQPSLPMHDIPFAQPQSVPAHPGRGYFHRETLDKLHLHPHAHRAVMSVPSQQPAGGTPSIQPESSPLERPAHGYPFKPIVPGPLSGPVLAPELQQSLAYSRSPASTLPSTLPAVPSTSGPSSRQTDSTGSISPRTNHDNSLPAPVFSSTSPITNRNDILVTDPAVKNRKYVVEREIQCIKCSSVIGRLLLRGTQEEFEHQYSLYFQCTRCHNTPALPVVSRKRSRTTEDTSLPTICDVCHRTRGIGGVVMKDREVSVPYAIEIVCMSCFSRYSRCSDCGGGFLGNRKTCRLSHARLGHGELEIGVWRAPQELKDQKDLQSVIASCKKLWQERVLAKLATPEVLEGEQEQPLRNYQDIETVLSRGWPAHESLLLEFPPDAGLHKRYICLLWTKSKGRRNRKPNPNPGPVNADDPDQLAEGLRRTREFAPEGCTLVAIFVCDWDMKAGTVLVSTSVPFESQDAEDRGAVSMGEVLGQILKDRAEHNAKHPGDPVPAPLHLWVGIRAVSPLHGARFIDSMNRRGFLLLSEYIARHPDVDPDIFGEPPFGHLWLDDPWTTSGKNDTRPIEILVRWLGKDLDETQLEKLKGIEYGKRARETGRIKKRR
ncbi:hypothetical protein CTheo_3517 [Ceratobasidium theobromae]|uniref:Uncharacterized protein n=1 Tax=Ceratobasidium theobromae TaxID=1582974 RepID=A0A5N5QMM7_9AGAM|nr:hypothetical protein CTheo_3517 [Ceratobasidium theobromae]